MLQNIRIYKHFKHKKERASTQGISLSLSLSLPPSKKSFRRFLTDGLCKLSLEAGNLDNLWFVITLKKLIKPKKRSNLQVIFSQTLNKPKLCNIIIGIPNKILNYCFHYVYVFREIQ